MTLARQGRRKEEIAHAEAAVRQAEAAAQAAWAQADLVKAGARPGQREVAVRQMGEAEAALGLATANQRQVAVREAEAAAARAAWAQAQAAVEAAKAALDKFRVEAPAEGVIDDTHVRVGEVVKPGFSLATLIDFSDTYVTVYVPEPHLPRVRATCGRSAGKRGATARLGNVAKFLGVLEQAKSCIGDLAGDILRAHRFFSPDCT